ncbi:hypothetical protein [Sphingomonas sp. CFBP 8760]|uniref:hypothetical protein n=1 Tax=Sphingomonas sp. CFBP 8760 TaxID=2775282 RepID=UPI0017820C7C|nr:hypothetical protein [Sphingomonas sp. CFBP 8760]MBD8546103.1 hypothetical protein [Sphingomonas sp. CFBP 8760]
MSQESAPQWKRWYRWLFLIPVAIGLWMLVYGVGEWIRLTEALRTLPPEVVVSTATSALPPLGIGFISIGLLAWMPRTADGRNLRPIRIAHGRERDPGAIVVVIVLTMLVLFVVTGVTVRIVTSDVLSNSGYTEQVERVSPSSRYITSRWTR